MDLVQLRKWHRRVMIRIDGLDTPFEALYYLQEATHLYEELHNAITINDIEWPKEWIEEMMTMQSNLAGVIHYYSLCYDQLNADYIDR